jgi:aryl-alcohol dehydrogenase-like predicted oxidoreductase
MPIIGTSDLDVYPLSLGGNTFGWTSDEATSFAVLDAYVAAGGNFIDTADSYSAFAPGNSGGESETIIGKWMKARGNRSSVVIGTKVSQHPQFRGLAAKNVAAAADASLARLQTDYIDLYYAHRDDENTPLEETVGAFRALQEAGKIRHVAVSNYTAARVREWISIAQANGWPLPVALQPHYNLVFREPYESTLAPIAEEFELGVMPYFALASGFLSGKYRTTADLEGAARQRLATSYFSQAGLAVVDAMDAIATAHAAELPTVALAWLLAKPTVTAPIASARNVGQLGALTSGATLTLSAAEIEKLDKVSSQVAAS